MRNEYEYNLRCRIDDIEQQIDAMEDELDEIELQRGRECDEYASVEQEIHYLRVEYDTLSYELSVA